MNAVSSTHLCAVLMLVAPALPAAEHRLSNQHLRLSVDDRTGSLKVDRLDGRGFSVSDGLPMILMQEAGKPAELILKKVREARFHDKLGSGGRFDVTFADPHGGLSCNWRAQLYDGRPWVSLTADLQTDKGELAQLSPLQSLITRAGRPAAAGPWRVFRSNGYNASPDPHGSVALTNSTIYSQYVTAIYDPQSDEGMGLGFYSYHRASAQISWALKDNGAALTAVGLYYGYELKATGGITGESLLLDLSLEPLEALENYVEATCRTVNPQFNHALTPGVHSPWFIYGDQVTYDQMLFEAGNVSETIFGKYYGHTAAGVGLWQTQHIKPGVKQQSLNDLANYYGFGEEKIDTKRYGAMTLSEFLERLRGMHLDPMSGMFYCSAGSECTVAREHPAWVIDNAIDYSNPAARRWLAGIIQGMGNNGIQYFWTDFNSAGPLRATHDPAMVRGFELPRAGMRTIRQHLKRPPLIGTYTTPSNLFLGLADRVRVSYDIVGDITTLPRIIRDVAGCYFYHNRFWLNDPDAVMIKGNGIKMTPNEPRIRVALGAIASSFLTTGDRIYTYTPEQQWLLTLLLPAYGTAARPLDLMRRDVPEEFVTPIKTDWDEWCVLTYINLNKEERSYSVEPARLGLKSEGQYLLYDFWPQRFLGRLTPGQSFKVAGEDTRCLLIRAVPRHPWVLSSNMHYTQGGVDLKEVRWNAPDGKLSGTALRHPGAEGRLTLYVPEGYRLKEASAPVETAGAGQDPHVVRLKLTFKDKALPWSATLAKE